MNSGQSRYFSLTVNNNHHHVIMALMGIQESNETYVDLTWHQLQRHPRAPRGRSGSNLGRFVRSLFVGRSGKS